MEKDEEFQLTGKLFPCLSNVQFQMESADTVKGARLCPRRLAVMMNISSGAWLRVTALSRVTLFVACVKSAARESSRTRPSLPRSARNGSEGMFRLFVVACEEWSP